MPLYDYRCACCGAAFEVQHPISAGTPPCPHCKGEAVKVFLTAPAVHDKMARGRELAVQSLQPTRPEGGHQHGPGCGCVQH